MTGKQAFNDLGNKLKKEVEEKHEAEAKEIAAVTNSLSMIQSNPELAQLYKENAGVGSQNLGGSMPQLKVHATGKSSKNQLANGEEPNDGYFFLTSTKEQFKEIECHILTISEGFRAPDMNGKDKFNQILAGVIVNEGAFNPCMMYFTGMKLSYLWAFGREAAAYTRNPSTPIPLFALRVKLTTEKVKTDFGSNWVIKFEIMKEEGGMPIVVSDIPLFKKLKAGAEKAEDTIQVLIQAKAQGVARDIEPSIEAPADIDATIKESEIPF